MDAVLTWFRQNNVSFEMVLVTLILLVATALLILLLNRILLKHSEEWGHGCRSHMKLL